MPFTSTSRAYSAALISCFDQKQTMHEYADGLRRQHPMLLYMTKQNAYKTL
jgi:hypothetical protein